MDFLSIHIFTHRLRYIEVFVHRHCIQNLFRIAFKWVLQCYWVQPRENNNKKKQKILSCLANGEIHSKELRTEVLSLLFGQDKTANLSLYKLSPPHNFWNSTFLLYPNTDASEELIKNCIKIEKMLKATWEGKHHSEMVLKSVPSGILTTKPEITVDLLASRAVQ